MKYKMAPGWQYRVRIAGLQILQAISSVATAGGYSKEDTGQGT